MKIGTICRDTISNTYVLIICPARTLTTSDPDQVKIYRSWTYKPLRLKEKLDYYLAEMPLKEAT